MDGWIQNQCPKSLVIGGLEGVVFFRATKAEDTKRIYGVCQEAEAGNCEYMFEPAARFARANMRHKQLLNEDLARRLSNITTSCAA